jgi:hypothetical protein
VASQEDIQKLRILINEPDDTNGYTDEVLGDIIDGTESLNGAASAVWTSKAGTYSTMVDVSESGSSRKLGDLYKNALGMSKHYQDLEDAATPTPVADAPILRRLSRGFP